MAVKGHHARDSCHWAGWSTIRLYHYSSGKYRIAGYSGTYWSKFTGRSVSAKCARGNHWYVAGQRFHWWSNAAWLRGC
ncbi:hypothetical protein AB0L00_45485 [Actinoallomurus sp. NPDC052308]|uniref:hypothetical protein n=1 Tax=Actinoallomurus sp. NPDC052308 TaxID=3155530 RepID=UPI0034373458